MRSLAWRLLGLLVTLIAGSFLIFAALYIAPGDPVAFLTGGRNLPPAALEALRQQYHLNEPFLIRYWDWVTAAVHGNLGTSIVYGQPISQIVAPAAETTAVLIAMASTLSLVAGVGMGIIGTAKNRAIDTSVVVLTAAAVAMPGFLVALLLATVFAVKLGWFPLLGNGTGVGGTLYHLVLPAVALAVSSSAFLARVTRASARTEQRREFVETARARGMPERDVFTRHVLRNAMLPIITTTGLTIIGLLASTIVVENVFSLNGLGSVLITAVQQKDFPVVQAVSLIYVVTFFLISIIVDLLYTRLDPRVRLREEPT
jgi:peptide/nickel transport system permease protein